MIIFKRLNGIHILLVVLLSLLLFSGCVTHETYIKNEETYSQRIQIGNNPTFLFFGENLTLNDYSLRFKRPTPGTLGPYLQLFPYRKNIEGRRYVFSKNGLQLYTIDIISSDRELQFGSSSITFDMDMGIIVHNNDSYKEEFKINFDEQQPYVIFNDRNMGKIIFDYYKSGNKNTPGKGFEFFDGFKISVNNEEFGINAFHPSSLYLKNNPEITDKMALYILATYASYLHNNHK